MHTLILKHLGWTQYNIAGIRFLILHVGHMLYVCLDYLCLLVDGNELI